MACDLKPKKKMEERVGFEPTIPFARDNGFQDRRFRPLSHLSKDVTYTQNNNYFCEISKKIE